MARRYLVEVSREEINIYIHTYSLEPREPMK